MRSRCGFAAVGVGKIFPISGKDFDEAFDNIRTQSGATGKEFEKLEGVFKSVIGSVPADFETASDTVAELARRTDLAREPMTRLAKQIDGAVKDHRFRRPGQRCRDHPAVR